MFVMSMLLPLVCLLELGVSSDGGIFGPEIISLQDITDFGKPNWDGSFRETHPAMVWEKEERRRRCSSAISDLEIVRSIELEFDPKTRGFVPVTEAPQRNQIDEGKRKAYESALMLLGSKTHRQLKKVFERMKEEEKNSESDSQITGRFQSIA